MARDMVRGPDLGQSLKARLDRLGWSQHGFARLVNKTGLASLSPGYLSQLINGQVERVGSDKLQAFAVVFGLGVDQLLDLSVEERPLATELPGTNDLPAPFRRVIQRIGQQLDARDWEIAAAFLEGLAARRGVRLADEAPAYGYQVPEQPAADQQGEAEKTA